MLPFPAMSATATRRARVLRARPTDAERVLWQHLRSRQLGAKFRRQHPLAGYVLDFYCEALRLAVEVDGGQHEIDPGPDEVRTAALGELGVQVVRFWNNDVLRNPEGVLQRLGEIVEQRRQLNPLPSGEGGSER